MNIHNLHNKNIYLCPKNNITEFYTKYLESENIMIKGYIDNYKKENDIIDKKNLKKDDVIIVYSPNYWKEIVKDFKKNNLLMLYNNNNSLQITPYKLFGGYDSSFVIDVNRNFTQKVFWADHLKKFHDKNEDFKYYGYEWGNPLNDQDELGNYLKIKNLLEHIIPENGHVVEIGTLGGKWTQYMFLAKKITCVDINNYFIDFIKKRYPSNIKKIDFYISKGNELTDIKTNSVDVVFCIDTLVRVEKEYIFDYLKEVARVLKPNGKAIIHIPNCDIEDCRNRNFTEVSTTEINDNAKQHFNHYSLDSKTIVHGTLLKINIEDQ